MSFVKIVIAVIVFCGGAWLSYEIVFGADVISPPAYLNRIPTPLFATNEDFQIFVVNSLNKLNQSKCGSISRY